MHFEGSRVFDFYVAPRRGVGNEACRNCLNAKAIVLNCQHLLANPNIEVFGGAEADAFDPGHIGGLGFAD